MKLTLSNGRIVVDLESEHGEDPCDSFFTSATYDDNGLQVEDAVLEELTETYPAVLAEKWFEDKVSQADFD